MPKACTKYSKKRKFHGNQHFNKKNVPISEGDGFPSTADINTRHSASARKIPLPKHSKSPDCGIPSTDPSITGFRFVDMEKLDSVFRLLPCKECYKCSLILQEKTLKRKGCASHLRLFCISCGWAKDFFTSLKIPNQRCFEVDRSLVYAMRSIGCGLAAAKRFCRLMNMPQPPRQTPYALHNKALLKAAKAVAVETMTSAAKEIHSIKPVFQDGLVKCGESCDGTWQRRGFSSLNGCVTAISMDNEKVLDVELLSKFCKKCREHENDADTPENAAWRADHEPKCQANYTGSAPNMEPEGALQIFSRSINKHQLLYTEYYGDGDSKSFNLMKD